MKPERVTQQKTTRMKISVKASLLICLMIGGATILRAQEDSVEVVITPKAGQDTTLLRIGGMKIIVLNSDNKGAKQEVIIDRDVTPEGDTLGETDETHINKQGKIQHWAGFGLGVDGMLSPSNSLNLPATAAFLEQDYGRSIGFTLNPFELDLRLYKQHIELVTGLGLQMSNYTFRSNYETLAVTDRLTSITDSTRSLEKNRLKAWYLNLPVMIGFCPSKSRSKSVHFAMGGVVGYRFASSLKQKYELGGETFKPKKKSDFYLNPFRFSAIASIGYGSTSLYAMYGLNPLFDKSKAPEVYPFTAGLQIMF